GGFAVCCLRQLLAVTAPSRVLSHTVRAGDGTRTRDIKLGRLALYQLSYSRIVLQKNPTPYSMVGEGFDPSKALAGRFTVCSFWPLRNPTDFCRRSRQS